MGRGLDNQCKLLNLLKNDKNYRKIIDLVNNQANRYWLGIRDNKVMVYYMGGKLLELSSTGLPSFDSKYIKHFPITLNNSNNKTNNIPNKIVNIVDWYNNQSQYADMIKHFQNDQCKREKKIQQEIMLENNKSNNSRWFLVDMEYSVSGLNYGRFDMIAVSKCKNKDGKHRISLIELKNGTDAFSGVKALKDSSGVYTNIESLGSGIAGHVVNFYKFLYSNNAKSNIDNLAEEISNILINYNDIGIKNTIPIIKKSEIDINADNVECWIICTSIKPQDNQKVINQVKHHIYDDKFDKNTSKLCLEKWWKPFLNRDFKQDYQKLNLKICTTDLGRIINETAFKLI